LASARAKKETVETGLFPQEATPRRRPRHANRKFCDESGLYYNVDLPKNGQPVTEVIVFAHGMRQSGMAAMRGMRTIVRELKPNAALYTPDGPLEPAAHELHDRGLLWAGMPKGQRDGAKMRPMQEIELAVTQAAARLNRFADAALKQHGLGNEALTMGGWSEGATIATHAGLARPGLVKPIYNFGGNYYLFDQLPQNEATVFYARTPNDEVVGTHLYRHALTAMKRQKVNVVVHQAPSGLRTHWMPIANRNFVPGSTHPLETKFVRKHMTTGHNVHPETVNAAYSFDSTGCASSMYGMKLLHEVEFKPLGARTLELGWRLLAKRQRAKLAPSQALPSLMERFSDLTARVRPAIVSRFRDIASRPLKYVFRLLIAGTAAGQAMAMGAENTTPRTHMPSPANEPHSPLAARTNNTHPQRTSQRITP